MKKKVFLPITLCILMSIFSSTTSASEAESEVEKDKKLSQLADQIVEEVGKGGKETILIIKKQGVRSKLMYNQAYRFAKLRRDGYDKKNGGLLDEIVDLEHAILFKRNTTEKEVSIINENGKQEKKKEVKMITKEE
ncbi:MAG: hypothetical protein AAF335_03105 [Bacteroidota bacterium]